MSKLIIIALSLGGAYGFFLADKGFMDLSENLITIGLALLLFLVGLDMGLDGTVVKKIRKAGMKILIFPVAAIIGTYIGALIGAIIIGIKWNEGLAIGSGFGWYTLAPIIIDPYSQELSAISFLHNIMREFFSLILIPIIAKYVGYLETTCLPGAPAMDVCIPVIEKSTSTEMVFYAFVTGTILSGLVPVLVPLFIGI